MDQKKKFKEFKENINKAFREVDFGVMLLENKNKLYVKWANEVTKEYIGKDILNKSLVDKGLINTRKIYQNNNINTIEKQSKKKSIKLIIEGEKKDFLANIIRLTKEFNHEIYLVFIDLEKKDDFSLIDNKAYKEIFEANWEMINKAKNPFLIVNQNNKILYTNCKAKEYGLKSSFSNNKDNKNDFSKKVKLINEENKESKIDLEKISKKENENNCEIKVKNNYFNPKVSKISVSDDQTYYLVILNNITKKRELEHKLKELNEELEKEAKVKTKKLRKAYDDLKRLDSLRSDFVNIAGHELRTPLTSIMGYSELLLNDSENLNKKQKEFLKIIFDECRHINNILKDMLDINKIESGKYEMSFSEHELIEIIEEVENVFKIDFKKSNINFIKVLKIDEDTKIRCDKSKLIQVLKNLISNAIKFTDEGGKITLNVIEDRNEFVFSVKDTGVGISKEEQDRIFEKFYQIGSHLRRNKNGSGLGLSIAREIISGHSGKIKVFSEKGYGTEFIFNIPKEIEKKKKEKIYY
ncbi:MAG: sensor histidine kinase [Candidatus Woesearchaeota archaeon]